MLPRTPIQLAEVPCQGSLYYVMDVDEHRKTHRPLNSIAKLGWGTLEVK